MKIIYMDSDGGLSIIHPTSEALQFMTIEEIALKDVPKGLSFAIVEDSEIPEDRTFRGAWEVDESLLIDGVGADYGNGSNNILIGFDSNRNPVFIDPEHEDEVHD